MFPNASYIKCCLINFIWYLHSHFFPSIYFAFTDDLLPWVSSLRSSSQLWKGWNHRAAPRAHIACTRRMGRMTNRSSRSVSMLLILGNVFFSHLNSCISFMCIHKETSDDCMRKAVFLGKSFSVWACWTISLHCDCAGWRRGSPCVP